MAGLTLGELGPHLLFMVKELYHVICMGVATLNGNGLVRGWALVLESPWLMALLAVLSGVFAWLCGRERHESAFSFWLGQRLRFFHLLCSLHAGFDPAVPRPICAAHRRGAYARVFVF